MKYEDLPDFSFAKNCPKCGESTKGRLKYSETCEYRAACQIVGKGHIHINCQFCGYGWAVKCKDASMEDDIVYIDDDKTAHQECAEKAFYENAEYLEKYAEDKGE